MQSESDKWGWKHVSVFGGFDKGSGTKRWKCNHCNLRYNGSYSRVRAHLLGFTGVGVKSCPAIDRSMREAFQILEEERLARKKKRTSGSGKPGKRIRTSQLSLNHIWKSISKEDVDDVVARFFYAEGLNINVVNSPYFYELIKAVASFGPGYESPSVDKLSGSFLIKEKARIEKSLAPVKESWSQTGCTILCVNCLDCTRGSSCINMFVSSPRGLMFFKAVRVNDGDTLENVFTGAISDAIMEVGSTNVLQIILNLGHGSESFESLMMPKFPHIFWSPCTSHSIRQLMENIAELDWIKPIVLYAKGIEQCMLTFQRSSPSVFTQDLKQSFDPLSAKFAPSYYLVHRIFEIKQALQEVVVSEEWKEWKLMTLSEDNISIEASILGDNFWSRTHLFLQLCEPFVRLLATFNIDKSVMGDVFDWRMRALEAIRRKGIDDNALNQVEVLLESRWDMYFSPLHAAGYILNPRYFGKNQAKDKTAMRGWKATLERYESDSGARRVLREQLSSYWRVEGSLGDEDAVDCRDKMDPVAWWENFGFETPHLQTLAVKILCQVSSVGICQFSDIPCQEAANMLKVERVEDLVFVQNNLRLHTLTDLDMEELQSRIVIAENLPEDHCHQNLMKVFSAVGSVKTIRTCQPQPSNTNASSASRSAKAEGMFFSNKLHAFVEYESIELAEKAVAELSEVGNWRSGLKVRLLLRRTSKPVHTRGKKGQHENEGNCEEDGVSTSELNEKQLEDSSQQSDIHSYEHTGEEHVNVNEKEGGQRKGRNRGRGKGRGRGHHHNHRGNHHMGTPPQNEQLLPIISKQPPGPRMPDGTRGFAMGRGKPLAVNNA